LPQRATANVNCRIMPESSARATQDAITKAVADPKVAVTPAKPFRTYIGKTAPLTSAVLDPIKQIAGQMWPGVPVVPTMQTGSTDARFFGDTPVYGINGMFLKPGESHQHGVDERMRVASLYQGRDFLYELTKLYASQ
jgi:acetylornithine deacetylase/succinyl-diaminopimelate desuccinylase-like protein